MISIIFFSCNGNGFCKDSNCICKPGYSGEDCSTVLCPNNCTNQN
jgi:hypothetical protein